MIKMPPIELLRSSYCLSFKCNWVAVYINEFRCVLHLAMTAQPCALGGKKMKKEDNDFSRM